MVQTQENDTPANPYTPPMANCTPVGGQGGRRSAAHALLVAAAAAAYCLFTVILLRSTPVDREAGECFLINLPAMLLWVAATHHTRRLGLGMGVVVVGIQCFIAYLTIASDIGDAAAAILINGVVICVIATVLLVPMLPLQRRGEDGR